ncbi:unnamed protein product, partial [marine sediment metagenome]
MLTGKYLDNYCPTLPAKEYEKLVEVRNNLMFELIQAGTCVEEVDCPICG